MKHINVTGAEQLFSRVLTLKLFPQSATLGLYIQSAIKFNVHLILKTM